jgi:hypothetical protein
MGNEKNQLLAIAGIGGLILICVLMFFVVGGNFLWFSASGVLGENLWVLPIVIIACQQLYVIPQFMKRYWKMSSDEEPSVVDLYVPIVNENVVFPSEKIGNAVNVVWFVVAALCVFNALPLLGIDFLANVLGSIAGSQFVSVFSFYSMFIAIALICAASVMRGTQYLSIRGEIYDLHNQYFGVRGVGIVSIVYRIMYFVPLVRSISLLMDMQVMDKLVKFNNVEDMKIELQEEDYDR